MMYTIDLLKGEGMPRQTDWRQVLMYVLVILVPLFMVGLTVRCYLNNQMKIEQYDARMAMYRNKMIQHKETRQQIDELRSEYKRCISLQNDLAQAICTHSQWSGVLRLLSESLPPEMIMRSLELKRLSFNEKIRDPDDLNKPRDITYYQYVLRITTECSDVSQANLVAEKYVKQLNESETMSYVRDVQIVSNYHEDKADGKYVVYEIDCVFKRMM